MGVNPVTGKKKQKWYTVKGNRRDAQKELTRLLRDIDTGEYSDPANLTLGAYLEKWLSDYARPTVSEKTYERYAEIIHNDIIPNLGHLLLGKIRPLDIQHYYSGALVSGRKDGKGGLSPRTVLHYHRILREALQQAVKWQLIGRNPSDSVEPPRPRHMEMKVLDNTQVITLLESTKGHRFYLPVLLAVCTGLRRGEILALKWSDIDFGKSALMVKRSLQETKTGIAFKDTKTARSRRTVSLSQLELDALMLEKKKQDELKEILGAVYQNNELVCAQDDGRPIIPRCLTAAFEHLLVKAGLPKIRFHDLRHTHATILLSQNVHPKVVSERLGHSTVGITLDTYSHVLPNMQEEAARKFHDALQAASEKNHRKDK